jgi:uncharacterized protein
MPKHFSNVIGFDDAPFPAGHIGPVKIVGTIYAKLRLNGILMGEVRKDGMDGAKKLIALISQSRFAESIQLIMLQGIALAGFNVIDFFFMFEQLELPILVVSRKLPHMEKIKDALLKMRYGHHKWNLIERLGPMQPVEHVYVQRIGLTLAEASTIVKEFTIAGHIPEPLRTAHLIAGAMANGQSSGRV